MGNWKIKKLRNLFYIIFSYSNIYLIIILLLVGITSCYKERTGCLDARATNFSFDADKECNGCCVYPQLRLVFEHKLWKDSTANLTYNTGVYKDGAGNDFRVKDIQFYISDARLLREDGTELYPVDSLRVSVQLTGGEAHTQNINDNVALVNRNSYAAAEMGKMVTTGKFTKIRFLIGLDNVLNQVIPNSLPDSITNHPLENLTMYVNADTGFIFNRLQLYKSAVQTDSIVTTYKILPPNNVLVELPFPTPLNIVEGYNPKITIRINYLSWFSGVNLKNDPPAMVATKIADNLRNSFSVTTVGLE